MNGHNVRMTITVLEEDSSMSRKCRECDGLGEGGMEWVKAKMLDGGCM